MRTGGGGVGGGVGYGPLRMSCVQGEGKKCFNKNVYVRTIWTTPSLIVKEGNVLFNDAPNTFYSRLYCVGHMVKDHIVREESRCQHMGYSFRLTARVLLYALSHRQDITYHVGRSLI